METQVNDFLRLLARERRLLLLGGLAVIAHGLSRGTKDADVWMEPGDSPDEWLASILRTVDAQSTPLSIHCLPDWQILDGNALIEAIADTGLIRINGLSVPLDIFRKPNGYETEQFDSIWENASQLNSDIRLPRAADLLSTKEFTGRDRDSGDWAFLIAKSRNEQGQALASAKTVDQAHKILSDYFDYEVCRQGLNNPDADVKNMILAELRKLADEGDPFAKELLEE